MVGQDGGRLSGTCCLARAAGVVRVRAPRGCVRVSPLSSAGVDAGGRSSPALGAGGALPAPRWPRTGCGDSGRTGGHRHGLHKGILFSRFPSLQWPWLVLPRLKAPRSQPLHLHQGGGGRTSRSKRPREGHWDQFRGAAGLPRLESSRLPPRLPAHGPPWFGCPSPRTRLPSRKKVEAEGGLFPVRPHYRVTPKCPPEQRSPVGPRSPPPQPSWGPHWL